MSPFSRRAVLLGGAGTLLAGCGVSKVYPDEPLVRFLEGSFRSRFMKARVNWTLSYPPGTGVGNVQPVVLALHGRGGDSRTALDSLHLDDVLDGTPGTPFTLATIDGGDHSYYHRRADGTDFVAMLVKEFFPVLREHQLSPNELGLYGWSMGGYGALLLASQGRVRPVAIAVSSPALFTRAESTPAGAFDDAEDFARHDVYARPGSLVGIPLHLDCGQGDSFYAVSRDFGSRLSGTVETRFPEGRHDATYWRAAAVPAFRFLSEEFYKARARAAGVEP